MDLVFLVCELGKGFVSVLQLVSKQLHSSRLHCSDVEWGAFAYHGI